MFCGISLGKMKILQSKVYLYYLGINDIMKYNMFFCLKGGFMKLKLENIGAIRNANIDINGLTVIAGENSTGKSTIGKLIYTIVKSLNNFKVENVGFQLSSLKDVTRDFSFIVKKQEMKVLEEDYYKDLCNNCDIFNLKNQPQNLLPIRWNGFFFFL